LAEESVFLDQLNEAFIVRRRPIIPADFKELVHGLL
jgi:hypothetical protein